MKPTVVNGVAVQMLNARGPSIGPLFTKGTTTITANSRNQVFKQISASSLHLNASLERKQLAEKLLVHQAGPSTYATHL